MVDFTAPDVVVGNIEAALERGVPCVVGTSGWDTDAVAGKAEEAGVAVFYAPNFAIGAVLMIRLAAEAARHIPRAEIVELHHETKVDAPSGTAKATAEAIGGDVPIHSVRLPGHRRASGGAPLTGRRAAHDPPRRLLPRGVRPGRPAGPGAAARSPTGRHGRPRHSPLNGVRPHLECATTSARTCHRSSRVPPHSRPAPQVVKGSDPRRLRSRGSPPALPGQDGSGRSAGLHDCIERAAPNGGPCSARF